MSLEIIKVKHLVNGVMDEFDLGEETKFIDSVNPATNEVIAKIPVGSVDLVNQAVIKAKDAFEIWSKSSVSDRSKLLHKLADLIERDLDDLAITESTDQGKTISQSRDVEMPRVAHNFRFFANSILFNNEKFTEMDASQAWNIRTRSPIGVTGIISPWNLPLYLLSFKIAPCIAYGNTCVCKPSEFTSLTAWKLCKLIGEAGIPKGVINMVFGDGTTGSAIVSHPDVKLISFTGSTVVGNIIEKAVAGQNLFKKLSLEMGGKNAAIVFEDADLQKSVSECVRSSFSNQGEICLCTSRIFVHQSLYKRFLEEFVKQARALKVGDPLDKETFMGPVASKVHMERIISYLEVTKGTFQCGYGKEKLPKALEKGFFILPTVITDVQDDDPVMTHELFGPVTAIVPFDSTDEVVARVNQSRYGLCASIHTSDQSRAIRVSKNLEVGTVWVNCWLIRDLRMPFGGCKLSGTGREGEDESKDFYTELKTVCLKY